MTAGDWRFLIFLLLFTVALLIFSAALENPTGGFAR